MLHVAVNRLHVHPGRFRLQKIEQRRQELHHRRIDHEQTEPAIGRFRIERGVIRAQGAHALENRAHRLRELQRLGRGLHAQ